MRALRLEKEETMRSLLRRTVMMKPATMTMATPMTARATLRPPTSGAG